MFRKSIDTNRPIKIALLGDGSTGKTSLFQKLTQYDSPNYRFGKRYKATENFQIKCFIRYHTFVLLYVAKSISCQ